MRRTRIGRVLGSGRWRALRVGAAAVAAVGVVGALLPAVASASPQKQALDWAEQSPPVKPSERAFASMAYDAATKTVVLFGGTASVYGSIGAALGDTWSWNGTTWTKLHPATSPPVRYAAAMAYDAATRTVVLFGGSSGGGIADLGDTWSWNGTTWTEQHPATSPPARLWATMAYDAATKTVVLFGGDVSDGDINDTWTWNGTTWTEQHPATSPPTQYAASMAYDAATRKVVLFNGIVTGVGGYTNHTWSWNGTTWTEHPRVQSLTNRWSASMAYDAATRTVVLFGGGTDSCRYNATFTWNGTTWTEQSPATSPSPRWEGAMAYDAATGTAVLFGGITDPTACKGPDRLLQQTWTWG
jgi:hypothetical protein